MLTYPLALGALPLPRFDRFISLTSPEDHAWQTKINTQISSLISTVQRLTSALEAHGIPIPPAPSTNGTLAAAATSPVIGADVDASVNAGVEQSVNVNVGDYASWATGDEETGYTGN